MNEVVDKFAALEAQIAERKGDFSLFALFLREDVPDRWDLVISAPWVGQKKQEAVDYVIAEIKSRLGSQNLITLSRIVLVDPDDASVRAVNKAFHVEHGRVEVKDSNFFGLPIKHAFIITSKRPDTPVASELSR